MKNSKLKRKQYLKRSLHIKKAKKILRKNDYKKVWSEFYKELQIELSWEDFTSEREWFFYFMRKFLDNRFFSETCIDFIEDSGNVLNLFDSKNHKFVWIWFDDGLSEKVFDYIENEVDFFSPYEFSEFLDFMITDTIYKDDDYLHSIIGAVTRACEEGCGKEYWKSKVVGLKRRIKNACKKSGIWNDENKKKFIEWSKHLKLWLNDELSYKDSKYIWDIIRILCDCSTEKELLEKFKDGNFLELSKKI